MLPNIHQSICERQSEMKNWVGLFHYLFLAACQETADWNVRQQT